MATSTLPPAATPPDDEPRAELAATVPVMAVAEPPVDVRAGSTDGRSASSEDVQDGTPVQRLTIPTFIFSHLAHHLGIGALQPLLPLIRNSFGLDYATSGLLLSAQGLSLGLGQIPISALADRTNKRIMIAVGLIGVGLTSIAVGLTSSPWQMVPLLVLSGIMAATYHAPASAYLSGAFSARGRGRALGTHVIGGSLAFVIAPLLAVGVARATGDWHPAFVVLGLFPLLSALTMLYLVWRHPERVDGPARESVMQVNALRALRGIGPLVGVALAEQLLTASMFAYIPLFIADRHGVPPDLAGLSIVVMTGIGILASPLAGALSDRLGRAPLLVAATASVGPLILAVTYVPRGWLPLLVVVLLLYGISMNTRMPVLESLFADAIPAHRRATVLGLYYFIGQESSGVTTPVVGRLIDLTDPVRAFTILGVLGTALSLLLFFNRQALLRPRAAAA